MLGRLKPQNQTILSQGRRGKNRIVKMIIPIRCQSCGKPIAQLYDEYKKRVDSGEKAKDVLNSLNLKRYCCRTMFMGHVDLLDTVAKFKKF